MPKNTLFWIFLSFIFSFGLRAQVLSTPHLNVVFEECQKADGSTLVIFDINDTILFAKDQVLQTHHKAHKAFFNSELLKLYDHAMVQSLWKIVQIHSNRSLVDPLIIDVLDYLRDNSINTIALTTAGGSNQGDQLSSEDWKIQLLHSLGIDFSSMFYWNCSFKINKQSLKHPSRYPLFKSGILFTCGLDKGFMLEVFLDILKYSPKSILFVDNKMKNIESVQAFCQRKGIHFLGIEYTAVRDFYTRSFDMPSVKKQFEILKKEKVWINQDKL